MPRIALALPLAAEDRVATELVRHGMELASRCSSADELAAAIERSQPDFAIVAASPRYLNDRLIAEADSAGVRILALVASDSERRHAASLGLLEVADVEAEWTVLETLMVGSREEPSPVAAVRRGRVIAVWGPAGSPGRTSLAICLASELAAAGHTVALADVDTFSGSVAPALGLLDEAPGFAAACRLAAADSLTQEELERIGQRYLSSRGSFWVLTGIGRPNRWPELSAERVGKVVRACRDWVDFTILDTGFSLENDEEISSDLFAPRRNAATLAALRGAGDVIAVGSADPVGLSRFLRAHVDLIETVDTEIVTVVMNRIRAGAIGPRATGQVRQALQRFGGISSPVFVPHDQAAFDTAVLTGKTVLDVAVRSPARLAIAKLVRERLAPQVSRSRRRVWPRRAPAGEPN